MMKLWTWLNGRKTEIAVVLTVVVSVLARRGVAIPEEVFMVTDGLLGLGLAHKFAKSVGPKVAPAAVPLFIAALLVTGCAALTPSSASNPQAPVAQAGGIFAPIILSPYPMDGNGQPVPISLTIGHSSDGDTSGKGGALRADQRQDVKPAVGTDAIKAAAAAATGGAAAVVEKVAEPEPTTKPAE